MQNGVSPWHVAAKHTYREDPLDGGQADLKGYRGRIARTIGPLPEKVCQGISARSFWPLAQLSRCSLKNFRLSVY